MVEQFINGHTLIATQQWLSDFVFACRVYLIEKMIKEFHVLGEYKISYVMLYYPFFEIQIILL